MDPRMLGPWCCRQSEVQTLCSASDAEMAAVRTPANGGANYSISAGVAIIPVTGLLVRGGSWWFESTNPDDVRSKVNAAARDERVSAIMLTINSPGGQAWGLQELAAAIRAARSNKAVIAQCGDVACSGAYWVASQATKVIASPMSHVGSIGTYGVLIDSSGAAAKAGLKVHVVKAGTFKGTAIPGTEVTPAQIEDRQRLVDQVNSFFLADVAAGRGMSGPAVSKLADGRVYLAADALKLRLIDAVQAPEVTFQNLAAAVARAGSQPQVAAPLAAGSGRNAKGPGMDAIQEFNAAVKAQMDERGQDRADATAVICRRDPELHRRYLLAVNAKNPVACQHIEARFAALT